MNLNLETGTKRIFTACIKYYTNNEYKHQQIKYTRINFFGIKIKRNSKSTHYTRDLIFK